MKKALSPSQLFKLACILLLGLSLGQGLQAAVEFSDDFADNADWTSPADFDGLDNSTNLSFGDLTPINGTAGAYTVYAVNLEKTLNLNLQNGQDYHMAWVSRYEGINSSNWSKAMVAFNHDGGVAADHVVIGAVSGNWYIMQEGVWWPKIGDGVSVPSDTNLLHYIKMNWNGSDLTMDMWVYSDSANLPSSEPTTGDSAYLGQAVFAGFSGTINKLSVDHNKGTPEGMTGYRIDEMRIATTFAEAIPSSGGGGGGGPTGGSAVIWPLGDSITWGAGGQPHVGSWGPSRHYRAYLENTFLAESVNYDFVGTLNGGANYATNSAMADGDHQGHGGLGVDHFLANVDSYVGQLSATPEYVTLMLGANDVINQTESTLQTKYDQLIDKLRTNLPNAEILVMGIGERVDQSLTTTRTAFNSMLSTLVATKVSGGDDKIRYIANPTTLAHVTDPNYDWQSNDVSDGVHPNYEGHQAIANAFWAELQPLIAASGGGGGGGGTSLTIYPIGDSITLGVDGEGWGGGNGAENYAPPAPWDNFPTASYLLGPGYRAYLYKLLQDEGYTLSTVGSSTASGGAPAWDGSSTNAGTILPGLAGMTGLQYHDGWSGETLEQVSGRVRGSSHVAAGPNVSLIMLGANNRGNTNASSLQGLIDTHYKPMIDELLTANAQAHVFVALVTPTNDGNESFPGVYNPLLQSMVSDYQSSGKNVHVVDLNTGMNPYVDSGDGLHPSQAGFQEIARRWRDAIVAAIPPSSTSAYDDWKSSEGITGNETDDDDGDGIANLVEYALGFSNSSRNEIQIAESSGKLNLTLAVDPTRDDITIAVDEIAGSLSSTWSTVAQSTAGADFVAQNGGTVVDNGDGTFTIDSATTLSAGSPVFLRIRVDRP